MKIDHESLGLAPPLAGGPPEALEGLPGEDAFPSAFGALLQLERMSQAEDWRHVLRLDTPPVSQRTIGPPPPPAATDAMTTPRMQLRRLLQRHAHWLNGGGRHNDGSSAHGERESIAAMLALLANYQDLEDEIVARQVTESRD